MGDPFRQPLWRREWVGLAVAFLAIAGLLLSVKVWWTERREALRAQTPEIISATYLGTGAIVERRFQPRESQAVFVRMEDGSKRMFRFGGPGPRLEGCKIGGPITLEQRGLTVSLGMSPCSGGPASKGEAVLK
jgi:hypothetical protein